MSQQLPDQTCSCFSSVALCYRLPVPHQVRSLACKFLDTVALAVKLWCPHSRIWLSNSKIQISMALLFKVLKSVNYLVVHQLCSRFICIPDHLLQSMLASGLSFGCLQVPVGAV